MRSLFAKILLWFVATIVITTLGIILTGALAMSEPRSRRLPFNLLLEFQLNEAVHAYETGGREQLSDTLRRFAGYGVAEPILTDSRGRDLVTGQDRSELILALGERVAGYGRERIVIGRQDEEGRFWYLLLLPRRRWLAWFLHPEYLWIAGVAVLLCYALAYHLTTPLRRMQKAVDCFKKGDFTARAGSGRQDELGQLARTLDQLAERIQTLLAAERRLLLDISHELRSPLARLSVAVELARSGPDREGPLNRIEKEAGRLNALVGELLQVTRAEGDPLALHSEPVRLDELLGAIVEDCAFEAQARRCALKLEAPAAVTVNGDAELLRRAAENVIRNAMRYEPEGERVEVVLRARPGSASILVRDHGPGVPEEALQRIFDPFYRVEQDRNRSSGGSGLGLAIARRAVELHRGKILARNARPGLAVEMEIPLAALSERGL